MNTLQSTQSTHLRQCCLITDGNSHRPDLLHKPNPHPDLLSEAMLPEIRTIAMLIASARHDFCQTHIRQFTDEADWFAARILVLKVRAFHLDNDMLPILNLANQRAQAFAIEHHLPFQPAILRPQTTQAHAKNILLIDCHLSGTPKHQLIANTQAVKQQLCNLLHGKVKNSPNAPKCSIVNA